MKMKINYLIVRKLHNSGIYPIYLKIWYKIISQLDNEN